MTYSKTSLFLASAAALMFAAPAYAGQKHDMKDPMKSTQKAEKVQTTTVTPADTDSSSVTVFSKQNMAVLGAIARQTPGVTPVQDTAGTTFYNHVVPNSQLFQVDYDIDVFDTVTFEHNGKTYVNKIVRQ